MADRSITYRFIGDASRLKSELGSASTSVRNFGKELTALDEKGEKMRAGLTVVGSAATKFGVVAAAGLAFAGKAAMDWEVAWTGVLKTVDGTPAQLSKLETGLRNLATETGFAHVEVAAVAEAAGQLGISTGGIENFTKTMLDMGVSTNLSAEEAATGLARFRNIMGITEAEISNTGSAMVELGNNFATTEGEILAMSLRIAGAGRQAGLTASDVLGLSAAMSSVGIEAEAGGTAMSLTMKRIGKEVETSGDNLSLFARVAGMSASEFQQAWGEDAAGTLQKFVAGLSDTERVGMSTNAVLAELGITGIREADALLRLSGNAEGLADALETANKGFTENIALAEESGKFYGTASQQAKQAWAEIKDAAIDAGEAMLPIIKAVAEAVSSMAGAWKSLPDSTQTAIVGFGAFMAVAGLSIGAISRVVNSIATMRQAYVDLGMSAEGAGKKMRIFTGRNAMRMGALGALAADQMLGLSEKAGMANTASMALMGTFLAPGWGTAAGALVGYMMDVAGANNNVEQAVRDANDAMSKATGFADMQKEMQSARDALEEYKKSFSTGDDSSWLDRFGMNPLKGGQIAKNWLEGVLGKSDVEEATEPVREMEYALMRSEDAATRLALALGAVGETRGGGWMDQLAVDAGLISESTVSIKEMDDAVRAAGPAIESLGDKWSGAGKKLSEMSDGELAQIADEIKRLDSESGRIDSLGEAFAGLDDDMSSAADAAKQLSDALSALLDPGMNLSEATDAWNSGLRNLKNNLADNDRSLTANTDAADKNRAAIRDMVKALQDRLVAEAEVDPDGGRLAKSLRKQRQDLINTATAAGFSREEVKAYLNQLNLTPEMVKTIIDLVGADKAKSEAQALKGYLDSIPAWKSTTIRVGWSVAANPLAAMMNPARILAGANADGGTIRRFDSGGTVPGQRDPYGDKVLTYLAPGEEVISNRFGQADRHRELLKAINANSFASGGTVGSSFTTFGIGNAASAQRDLSKQLASVAGVVSMFGAGLKGVDNSLKGLRKQLKAAEKELERERKKRSALVALSDSLADSIRSNYRSSLAGESPNPFVAGAMSPTEILRADMAQIRALNAARKDLRGKGVKGGALDALLQEMDVEGLTAMSGWSKKELRQYQRLYNQRESMLSSAGRVAGRDAYGDAIKAQTKEVRSLKAEVKGLRKDTRQAAKQASKDAAAGRNAQRRGARQGKSNRKRG